MTDKIEIEVWVAMNEDGSYAVGTSDDEAADALESNEGGYMRRLVKIKVKMAPPVVTESEVEIADDAGETEQVETEAA